MYNIIDTLYENSLILNIETYEEVYNIIKKFKKPMAFDILHFENDKRIDSFYYEELDYEIFGAALPVYSVYGDNTKTELSKLYDEHAQSCSTINEIKVSYFKKSDGLFLQENTVHLKSIDELRVLYKQLKVDKLYISEIEIYNEAEAIVGCIDFSIFNKSPFMAFYVKTDDLDAYYKFYREVVGHNTY